MLLAPKLFHLFEVRKAVGLGEWVKVTVANRWVVVDRNDAEAELNADPAGRHASGTPDQEALFRSLRVEKLQLFPGARVAPAVSSDRLPLRRWQRLERMDVPLKPEPDEDWVHELFFEAVGYHVTITHPANRTIAITTMSASMFSCAISSVPSFTVLPS